VVINDWERVCVSAVVVRTPVRQVVCVEEAG
jgi:hypothetical protein